MWLVPFLILCTSSFLPKTVRRIFLCFPSVVMITACWSEGRICTASNFYWTWEGDTSAAARITKLTFPTMDGTLSMETFSTMDGKLSMKNFSNHGWKTFCGKVFQPWMEYFPWKLFQPLIENLPWHISLRMNRNSSCIAHGSIASSFNFSKTQKKTLERLIFFSMPTIISM